VSSTTTWEPARTLNQRPMGASSEIAASPNSRKNGSARMRLAFSAMPTSSVGAEMVRRSVAKSSHVG
jgi:hypothetical protein